VETFLSLKTQPTYTNPSARYVYCSLFLVRMRRRLDGGKWVGEGMGRICYEIYLQSDMVSVLCSTLQYSTLSKGLEVDDIHLSKDSLEVSITGKWSCIDLFYEL